VNLDPEIAEHYRQGVERDRLATWGRLEAARTTELLARYLPAPPATVLDVGGAEGAYALPLAAAGYSVHLIDPVEAHIEAARAASARQASAPLAGATVGDARDLSTFGDDSVDAVMMLGPLYHLVDRPDRLSALREAHRVLRPGGRLLAAAISRFASTVDGLRTNAIVDPEFESMVVGDLQSGVHRNPHVATRPEWFTLAYFHRPDELAEEVTAAGFVDVDVLAIEGPVAIGAQTLNEPAARAAIMRAIARVEREPALIGASQHMMAVAVAPPT
jgi:ubiquinone/menaquinone biosynthesis C-methylase UbiE